MAAENDTDIEDDLSRGNLSPSPVMFYLLCSSCDSTETAPRSQEPHICAIQEKLRIGERRSLPGLKNCATYPEQNGS
jgi:hypothetical protein